MVPLWFPIAGQFSYESRISGQKEYLPVMIDILSIPGLIVSIILRVIADNPAGSDGELLNLVAKFLKATGRT